MKTRAKHQPRTKKNLKHLRKTKAYKKRRHHSKTRKGGKITFSDISRKVQGSVYRATQSKEEREADLNRINQTNAELQKIREDAEIKNRAYDYGEEDLLPREAESEYKQE